MTTPCYESQVNEKLKISPLVARAFLNQTLEHMKPYLDATGIKRDGLGVAEALDKVASESGLRIDTVAKIIQSDAKLFSISKQAFNRQREATSVKKAAEVVAERGAPKTASITRVYNDMRRAVLAGHSTVFPFTHARDLLYGPQAERRIFYKIVHDAYAFRGETGDINHQAALAEMKAKPTYQLQRSAGLDVGEGIQKGDILRPPESGTKLSEWINQMSKMVGESRLGKLLRLDPNNAVKSFDALKIGRSNLFDLYWDRTPLELKTEAYAQLLARDMNYATGSVKAPRGAAAQPLDRMVSAASDASGNVLLSSKLFYAKRMQAANILRYGPGRLGDLLSKGGGMTAEERAIANLGLRRWARIASTQLGILGVNFAFAKAFGLKLPNLTDPSKADYGRLRIGNFVVPLSPLMEAAKEPVRALATTISKRSAYEGGKELVRPVINALTPGIQLTGEQITGKEPFSGRTVPSIRNVIQPPKPGKTPPVGPGEYIGTRFAPIAIGGGIHEFYQALRNEGVSPSIATAFVKSAAGTITSGVAGTHIYEEQQKAPKVKQSLLERNPLAPGRRSRATNPLYQKRTP
ncbi:MAG: hypothetical protein DMF62_15585 [Acidobacteria bacterium]|nr:MAG: hypothetical protein DMF62_15585 [Acidobacteriota bacterium]